MHKRKTTLALAYLKDHPKSAARTLEQGQPAELAEFLADTPTSYAGPVVAHLLPHVSAGACKLMNVETAASKISLLEAPTIAAIFRYLEPEFRVKLSGHFPLRKRRAVATILGFSQNAVGSWMIPDAPVLPSDGNGRQVRTIIETVESAQKSDYLFAVDRDRRLIGRIHISDAMSLGTDQGVDASLKLNCRALNGRNPLVQAAEHPDWDVYDVMPIVGPNNRYTGILRHVDLRRGLRHLDKMARSQGEQGPLDSNIADYVHGLFSTFHAMAHMLDSDTRSS